MLSDSKGKTLTIGKEELDNYKDAMANLFVEIFDKDTPFEEKELV